MIGGYWESYTLSDASVRAAFHKAARDGQRYLVVLQETTFNPDKMEDSDTLHAVGDFAEIVPLMEANQKRLRIEKDHCEDVGVFLAGIFDLTQDYDAQAKISGLEQIGALLPPEIQREISPEGKQERRAQEARAERAAQIAALIAAREERAKQPWYRWIF